MELHACPPCRVGFGGSITYVTVPTARAPRPRASRISCFADAPRSRDVPRGGPRVPARGDDRVARRRATATRRDLTGWDESVRARSCSTRAGAAGLARRQPPDRVRRRGQAAELAGGGELRGRVPRRADDRHRGGARRADRARVRVGRAARAVPARRDRRVPAPRASRTPRPAPDPTSRTSRRPRSTTATAASCSTARRCSSPARTRATGAARSRVPIRQSSRIARPVDVPHRPAHARRDRRACPHRERLDARHHPLRRRSRAVATRCSASATTAGGSWARRCSSERSGMAWLGWATRNVHALLEAFRGTTDALARRRARRPRDPLVRRVPARGAGARAPGRRAARRWSRRR